MKVLVFLYILHVMSGVVFLFSYYENSNLFTNAVIEGEELFHITPIENQTMETVELRSILQYILQPSDVFVSRQALPLCIKILWPSVTSCDLSTIGRLHNHLVLDRLFCLIRPISSTIQHV